MKQTPLIQRKVKEVVPMAKTSMKARTKATKGFIAT